MSIEPIVTGDWPGFSRIPVATPKGTLSVRTGGPIDGPPVLFNHSILTSSAVWHRQAVQLASNGWRVLCLDTRGHGSSEAPVGPYAMDDLVADDIAVLDALEVPRAHVVGVSLGGMTGFGLGGYHSDRLLSLCVIARARRRAAAFCRRMGRPDRSCRARGNCTAGAPHGGAVVRTVLPRRSPCHCRCASWLYPRNKPGRLRRLRARHPGACLPRCGQPHRRAFNAANRHT